MNKQEITATISKKTGLTKNDSELALVAFTDVVAEQLAVGKKVSIIGFGTFSVADRSERTGRNPQNGQEITIPAAKVPKFKPSKALKDLLNIWEVIIWKINTKI